MRPRRAYGRRVARPSKYTADDILDGALHAVALHGRQASVADISQATGVTTGSIYHRFSSRDELFARLWLRSIRRFHAGLLKLAAQEDAGLALVEGAVYVVSYSRDNREEALAMTLWRQPALARTGPEAVREEALHINDDYLSVTRALVARRYGRVTPRRMELVTAACQAVPYGLVRPTWPREPLSPTGSTKSCAPPPGRSWTSATKSRDHLRGDATTSSLPARRAAAAMPSGGTLSAMSPVRSCHVPTSKLPTTPNLVESART